MLPIRNAIVLLAGRGSRLSPLTDDRPKALLDVAGEPLLTRMLRQLHTVGVTRAILATGYRGELIQAIVPGFHGLPQDIAFAHNPAWESTNNAESLRLALRQVRRQPFLLVDGDVLLRDSAWLNDMLQTEGNTLGLSPSDTLGEEEMKVWLDNPQTPGRPMVVGLSKNLDPKICQGESIGVQTIAHGDDVEKLQTKLERMSPEQKRTAYYEDLFAEMIVEGTPFFVRQIDPHSWYEIDTAEDYQRATELASTWRR